MSLPSHFTMASAIIKNFIFYTRSINWSKERLNEYQNKKLVEIVQYAGKHVPYYRNLFKEIGLDTKNFKGIEDIELIPLLDKDTLRTRSKEFISDVSSHYKVSINTTSGSTGTPLNLHIDNVSSSHKYGAFATAYIWSGYKIGGLRFVIKGFSESKSEPYGYDLLRNMIFLNSSKMTRENCLGVLKLLNKKKINIYEGYARSFIDFYQYIEESGVKIIPPKGLICYGETVTSTMREFIEKSYKTNLYDFYSHAENSVMICQASDCNLYFMESYFYPELINSDGSQSESGFGELVGTSFNNYAMPLIRYKTRDYIKMCPNQSDSTFRRVESIEGRMDDHILLPDGRKIYFAEGAINYATGVIAAQYIQEDRESLIVNLITDSSFDERSYTGIQAGLEKRIGDSLKLVFRRVNELEKKKSGKAPFIINRIKEN